MSRYTDFLSQLESLWLRLIPLAIVGLVFAEAPVLVSGNAQRSSFYHDLVVVYAVIVRLIFAAHTDREALRRRYSHNFLG
jgi:hypothetical protein